MYNKRQELILDYVKAQENAARKEIEAYISKAFPEKNSRVTVLRDLELLIADGLVEKTGKARGTAYRLSPRSRLLDTMDVNAYFDQEPDQRVLRSEIFNFDAWPHLTGLLTQTEQRELDVLNAQYRKNRAALTPIALQKELDRLTIEFSWKSSKIEGNTYSLLDTERLIKENIEAQGNTRAESVMILNHKKGILLFYEQNNLSYFKTIFLDQFRQAVTKYF